MCRMSAWPCAMLWKPRIPCRRNGCREGCFRACLLFSWGASSYPFQIGSSSLILRVSSGWTPLLPPGYLPGLDEETGGRRAGNVYLRVTRPDCLSDGRKNLISRPGLLVEFFLDAEILPCAGGSRILHPEYCEVRRQVILRRGKNSACFVIGKKPFAERMTTVVPTSDAVVDLKPSGRMGTAGNE